MPGASFLDTNVLVYFALQRSSRSNRAAEIVEAGGYISVQVLNEFTNVARSKIRMEWIEIGDAVALVEDLLEVRPLTIEIHARARGLAERYGFHIYDAMIVASALEAGCATLYSEDMQHGQLVADRLRIINPFL